MTRGCSVIIQVELNGMIEAFFIHFLSINNFDDKHLRKNFHTKDSE